MKSQRFAAGAAGLALIALAMAFPSRKVVTNDAASLGKIIPAGTMKSRRSGHTATLLRTGKVLIAGGMVRNWDFIADAELYDPLTGKFIPTAQMTSPRVGHTATLLPDNRVLIAGGSSGPYQNVSRAEVYDPANDRFEVVGSLMTARSDAAAVLLPNGKVLIVGGTSGADWNRIAGAEIYDPATGKFTATGSMGLPRVSFTMCLLRDGRVLVSGGSVGGRYPNTEVTASAEIYDPVTGKFTSTGSMIIPRHKHAAVLLADGRVLIVGGSDNRDWRGKFDSMEIYDPATGKFKDAGNLNAPRFKLTRAMVRMPDGSVLVAGGAGHPEILDSRSLQSSPVPGPEMEGRYFSTATMLADGRVLIAGGYGDNIEPSSNEAWIYVPATHPIIRGAGQK